MSDRSYTPQGSQSTNRYTPQQPLSPWRPVSQPYGAVKQPVAAQQALRPEPEEVSPQNFASHLSGSNGGSQPPQSNFTAGSQFSGRSGVSRMPILLGLGGLILLIVLIIGGLWGYRQIQSRLMMADNVLPEGGWNFDELEVIPEETPIMLDASPSAEVITIEATPVATDSTTNKGGVTVSPTPTPTPVPSTPQPTTAPTTGQRPGDWVEHKFVTEKVAFFAPPAWGADSVRNLDTNIVAIRFWPGNNPADGWGFMDIKPNWDNTGNAQQQAKNFQITPDLMAVKIDPPQKQAQTLDAYETNYYFERNGRVYVFTCRHNWDQNRYQTCETMLQSIRFW